MHTHTPGRALSKLTLVYLSVAKTPLRLWLVKQALISGNMRKSDMWGRKKLKLLTVSVNE